MPEVGAGAPVVVFEDVVEVVVVIGLLVVVVTGLEVVALVVEEVVVGLYVVVLAVGAGAGPSVP